MKAQRWVSIRWENYYLKAHDRGKLSFEGRGFGPATIFLREHLGGNSFAFQNLDSGLYMATNDASELGQDPEVGARQRWTEVEVGRDAIGLMSYHNRFLGVTDLDQRPSGGGFGYTLESQATTRSDELIVLHYVDPPEGMLPFTLEAKVSATVGPEPVTIEQFRSVIEDDPQPQIDPAAAEAIMKAKKVRAARPID